jgi:hypothetical protein
MKVLKGKDGSISYSLSHKKDDNGTAVLAYINGEFWMVPLLEYVPAIRVQMKRIEADTE